MNIIILKTSTFGCAVFFSFYLFVIQFFVLLYINAIVYQSFFDEDDISGGTNREVSESQLGLFC
jgi:hypothetical protein